ncbi:MAG: Bro-N domain-containing protein [Candidatus Aenigmarchaeota archaeon]|nr:Bro-N domain-containing protein [Candidatus Aenigmarchaeota archaeon]
MDGKTALIMFQGKNIRRVWFNDEWWFVATDIIGAITESKDPSGYIKDMKRRDEGFSHGWGQIAIPLLVDTPGGRQNMNCVSVKGAFRLIQSIPSKNAEPFKMWLAQVGYDHVREIENPELAQQRMKAIYQAKGYSEDWIEKRVRGIAIRDELTDEWKKRGVKEEKDFAVLTAEISKATFGMTPNEYRQFKGLKKENLRDHMNDLELIFSMLGERVSTEITRKEDAQGYREVEDAAKRGGRVAGNATKETEQELGRPITSKENYLHNPEKEKTATKKKRTGA